MAPRGNRSHRFRPALTALLYAGLVLVVTAMSYISELRKLARGFSTEIFDPMLYAWLLTWPLSSMVDDWLPNYPRSFDVDVYRRIVTIRALGFAAAGVAQAIFLGLLLQGLRILWRYLSKRRERT